MPFNIHCIFFFTKLLAELFNMHFYIFKLTNTQAHYIKLMSTFLIYYILHHFNASQKYVFYKWQTEKIDTSIKLKYN